MPGSPSTPGMPGARSRSRYARAADRRGTPFALTVGAQRTLGRRSAGRRHDGPAPDADGRRTMRRAPQNTPTYEGRALPRPDEEVMDQGLSFDMQTMLGRRQMLRAVGLGA